MWTSLQLLAGILFSVRAATLIQPEWGYFFDQNEQGPDTYSFGYDIEDPGTRNIQFRRERRLPNGTVTGSYGLVEPDGNIKLVHYIADSLGYRVRIENSQRPHEVFPLQPSLRDWSLPGEPRPPPHWPSLWDAPAAHRDHRPLSGGLQHALLSLQNLGSPVEEQRTPPSHLGASTPPSRHNYLRESDGDQSQNYPYYISAPQDLPTDEDNYPLYTVDE